MTSDASESPLTSSATGHSAQLDAIPSTVRHDLVRACLDDERATVSSWRTRELYGVGVGSRIHRVSGEASTGAGQTSWSLVIKTFAVDAGGLGAASEDVSAWNYWKREWLAFHAPWLQTVDGSLVAPRRLGAGEDERGQAWVAMEDLSRHDDRPWSLTRFHTVARCLGRFQAPYLVGQQLPTDPWVSRDWLRGFTDPFAGLIDQLPQLADHPLVRRILTDSMIDELVRLWRDREIVLETLAALPQTLCHHDLYPRNAFVRSTARGADQCVAIDWAYVGYGAIGEDLAGLVGTSLVWFEADADQAEAVETACLEGYVEGLRAGGWDGNVDDVMLGFLARASLANSLGTLAPAIMVATDSNLHPVVEEAFGRPVEEILDNLGATLRIERQHVRRLWSLLPTARRRPGSRDGG